MGLAGQSGEANAPFVFHQSSRTLRTALILLLVWLALATLWLAVDAALWIVALLAAATLPALYDFVKARRAELMLDRSGLRWRSEAMSGEVPMAQIARVRLETRLDLSIRVRVMTVAGKRVTLPQDCVPPVEHLQAALDSYGIPHARHHFALLS